MTIFSTFGTAGSGLKAMRTWLDAVADNIANMNDVSKTSDPAFQQRYVVAQAVDYGKAGQPGVVAGTQISQIAYGDAGGHIVHDPQHPLADANGDVKYPNIDLGDQMVQMMIAQRGYQANLAVVDRARDAYMAALSIGKGS